MNKIPVLIVGAGPSGLMMACELARHGIPFRIIDQKPERTATSNAVWIQTRTIEILEDVGILDKFLRRGRICKAINFYFKSNPLTKLALSYLDSLHRYVLMLPQSETEQILNAYLESMNHYVERPLKLVDIKQVNKTTDTVVLNGEGQTEVISCDWLIACDGINSSIRDMCKIHFPGDDIHEQCMVADTKMSSFASTDEIHVFLNKGQVLAAFPIGQSRYRVGANLHLDHPRSFFTEKEVKELIAERASNEFIPESVSWISPFWIHSRMADKMRHNGTFLVGDSAHIHSPALGQGMNTGMQDAYNLAWKLSLVIQGKAKASILDSYQDERYPVIKDTVQRSDTFTKVAMYDKSLRVKIRNLMMKLVYGIPYLSNKTSMRITQLDLRYTDSPIIDYTDEPRASLVEQGKRAPDVVIESSKRLYQYFHPTRHNVLLFAGKSPKSDELFNLKEIKKALNMMYDDTMRVHLVSQNPDESTKRTIYDKNAVIHKKYRVKRPSIFVIRPDGYIAYYSSSPYEYDIQSFFEKYLYS